MKCRVLKVLSHGLTLLAAATALSTATANLQEADAASANASAGSGKKPNILFIITDQRLLTAITSPKSCPL
jgi:hypothetical protein